MNSIWMIKLRVGRSNVVFRTNYFNALNLPPKGFPFNNLSDWVTAYLMCEWNDVKILKDITKGE